MVTTAFGKAEIAEQVTLKQRVNGKQFSTLVQLLEDDRGEWLIRFAYATDGVARRGPVTLRGSDVERLRVWENAVEGDKKIISNRVVATSFKISFSSAAVLDSDRYFPGEG